MRTSKSPQVRRNTSGIPCTMVLMVYFALSLAIGLSCHHPPHDAGVSGRRPTSPKHPHRVDVSIKTTGPHDFAVRKSIDRLTIPPRPPQPTPNVRDDRDTPLLMGCGMTSLLWLCLPNGKAEYFSQQGWTGFWVICPSGRFWRSHSGAMRSIEPGILSSRISGSDFLAAISGFH